MTPSNRPPSRRFQPKRWSDILVPALLLVLLFGLLAALAIVAATLV